jgi:hypothetical protein
MAKTFRSAFFFSRWWNTILARAGRKKTAREADTERNPKQNNLFEGYQRTRRPKKTTPRWPARSNSERGIPAVQQKPRSTAPRTINDQKNNNNTNQGRPKKKKGERGEQQQLVEGAG